MQPAVLTEETFNTQKVPAYLKAQQNWSATPLSERLRVLCAARHLLASHSGEIIDAIPEDLVRSRADSYVAELLPLLAAIKFLEQEAQHILKPRKLGRKGLPFWLAGVESEVDRVPFGCVLIVGPSNYPLFLPGVQAFQALAAGNAVIWKPGRQGASVAEAVSRYLSHAGLPQGLLQVTDESPQRIYDAIHIGVDKIFFTGSASTGRLVLEAAAATITPVVAELSGCDAVVVLPSAEIARVVEAVCFGMRFNGSATCMAPRRLILVGHGHDDLLATLADRFSRMDGIPINKSTRGLIEDLIEDAEASGARICGCVNDAEIKPLLILDGTPEMRCASTDIFAPILTVLRADDNDGVLALQECCPFALTGAVFGEEKEALALSVRLRVGTVIVNDLIAPTADPRVPFGGRKRSGFGTTRGREGLLEMTLPKTILRRTGHSVRHYEVTTPNHEALFEGLMTATHGKKLRDRLRGIGRMFSAAKRLN